MVVSIKRKSTLRWCLSMKVSITGSIRFKEVSVNGKPIGKHINRNNGQINLKRTPCFAVDVYRNRSAALQNCDYSSHGA